MLSTACRRPSNYRQIRDDRRIRANSQRTCPATFDENMTSMLHNSSSSSSDARLTGIEKTATNSGILIIFIHTETKSVAHKQKNK